MLPRVKDVERIVVQIPFRDSVAKWFSISANHCQVIEVIRIITDDPDVVGYGETMIDYVAVSHSVTDEGVARIIGRPISDLMTDETLGAGVQMALYDAVGKATGMSVHQLLGKPMVRQWCPVSWWNMEAPPDVLAAEAKLALEAGYMAHKIKARPWFDIYEQVNQISKVTPIGYAIDIDWNCQLNQSANAVPVLAELSLQERVGLFEDPIARDDVVGQRAVRERASRPIATHFAEDLFVEQMRENAVDGYVVDGSINRVLKIGTLLATHNKGAFIQLCGSGITVALSLQLGAILSQAHWPYVSMVTSFKEDLLATPLTIKGGYAKVPDGPGLGIEVDDNALDRLRMKPPYKLQLPRRIYTFNVGDGRSKKYATVAQLWADTQIQGNMPHQHRGSSMEILDDDGSKSFDSLFAQASKHPIWDVAGK
jgi:L-alanine-DL-glutamate epimerase-like enolase superfamily enzyme